jgi:hypothetical protein
LIVRHQFESVGVNFVTSADSPLQLGILTHKQGTQVAAHFHRESTRTVHHVQEVLHIEYGTVEATFYAKDGSKVGSRVLDAGDTILLLDGGHGFRILEDARIVEVKQGPYYGAAEDKECLRPG